MSVKTNELQRIADRSKVSDFLVESDELGTGRYAADIFNNPILCGQLKYGLGWKIGDPTPETPTTEVTSE